jgi:hypothetical protein
VLLVEFGEVGLEDSGEFGEEREDDQNVGVGIRRGDQVNILLLDMAIGNGVQGHDWCTDSFQEH